MSELNTRVRFRVRSSQLQSVPVDDTLSIQGQAADAAAVGEALAQKADLSQVTGISVNGQSADQQGAILIDGSDIPVNGEDNTTLDEAISELQDRTAEDIPVSSAAGAQTIAQLLANTVNRDASAIPMSSTDQTTVKAAVEAVQGDVETLETDMETVKGWTAADVPYTTGEDVPSVKDKLDELGTDVSAIEAWDSDDIKYTAEGEDSVKDKIDDLNSGRVRTVNNVDPDPNGNVQLNTVSYADDLTTDDNIQVDAPFIVRTAGGSASINSGHAWIRRLKGSGTHVGYVAEDLRMTVIPEEREEGVDPITATLDRDTFITYVNASTQFSMVYSTAWKVNGDEVTPADYGITITGTPIAGDEIVIRYVKEVRGEIIMADPEMLVSTGWNLYNPDEGYARVAAYGGKYKIGGTYSTIRFAKIPGGTSHAVTVDANGLFTVPEDGYVLITGGNSTSTYVLCCWSDWEGGYEGDFSVYEEHVIDLTAIMVSFPYGLCRIGDIYDEINFNTKQIIPRVKRIQYTDEARADAESSGLAYIFDESYIYIEMTAEEIAEATSSFALENQTEVDSHGIEFFTGTNWEVGTEIAYGASLKDKLRRDVLTISQQTLSEEQKAQVLENIGADAMVAPIQAVLSEAFKLVEKTCSVAAVNAGKTKGLTAAAFGFEEIEGYTPVAVVRYSTGTSALCPYGILPTLNGTVMSLRNVTTSATSAATATVRMLYVRNELLPVES